MGFLGGSEDKVSACNVGDLGLIPGCGCKELDTAERLHFHFKSERDLSG